jgi:hypothetical protein
MQEKLTVAAATATSITPGHIQPGACTFMMQTACTNWTVNVSYYDYGSGTYILMMQYNTASNANQVIASLPMIDAPYQFAFDNLSATSTVFVATLVSE